MSNANSTAYPWDELNHDGTMYMQHVGLTKRELFAAMAMQGHISGGGFDSDSLAGWCVEYADALLAELEKSP